MGTASAKTNTQRKPQLAAWSSAVLQFGNSKANVRAAATRRALPHCLTASTHALCVQAPAAAQMIAQFFAPPTDASATLACFALGIPLQGGASPPAAVAAAADPGAAAEAQKVEAERAAAAEEVARKAAAEKAAAEKAAAEKAAAEKAAAEADAAAAAEAEAAQKAEAERIAAEESAATEAEAAQTKTPPKNSRAGVPFAPAGRASRVLPPPRPPRAPAPAPAPRWEALHAAAERGDVPGVQAGLQAGVNPDLRDGAEATALHWAARNGHVAVVGALVGGGAAVGAVDENGYTALHNAAVRGHAAVVGALAGAGAGVEAVTKGGDTPLSLAACHGHTEAAAALLGAGADATRPTYLGKTAAEWAREAGHPAVAKLIEDHLAQSAAAAAAEAEATRVAVARAAAEIAAAEKAAPEKAAAEAEAARAAEAHLAQQAEPEPERAPMASLHRAAERGDVPGVQAGLQAGVNPDLRDGREWTALHCAAWNGHAAVVGALVGGSAAVGAVDMFGHTALHLAAQHGHAAVVGALAGAGAGVDAATKDGVTTPLSLAASNGHTEAAAALLGAGADATRPTDQGKTAAEWAREAGYPAVAMLIEDHLAQSAAAAAAEAEATRVAVARAAAENAAAEKAAAEKAAAEAEAARAAEAHLAQQAEPEPEPAGATAEEGEPPQLDAWLNQIGMSGYSTQLKDYGYDQLKALLVASEADIAEMTRDADIKMKKPHRKLFLAEWKELTGAVGGASPPGSAASPAAVGGGATPPYASAAQAGGPSAAEVVTDTAAQIPDKYIAAENQLRLGQPEDATHGLKVLLGIDGPTLGKYMQDPIGAIEFEFKTHGSAEDMSNLRRVLGGTFHDQQTLESLVAHAHAKKARLEPQHVLALRLYTTSSYSQINNPLRKTPPQRPHPFAATTWYCDEGIKMLRAVAAQRSDAHTMQVFWRGMKDVGLNVEFLQKGGTEFACMSTSASMEVAVNFAKSKLPLVFKFETKVQPWPRTRHPVRINWLCTSLSNTAACMHVCLRAQDFTSRGADVSFLSVYPGEKEALYPPLTYLRGVGMNKEVLGGVEVVVATVEPVFM
eukprot:COSAG01_NODE_339_length_18653_cov_21.648378_14_plen_1072_part_00